MKRKVIAFMAAAILAFSIPACGAKEPASGGEAQVEEAESTEETEEIQETEAGPEGIGEAAAYPLQEYTFTKSVSDKDLERPLIAYGLELDQEEDRVQGNSLDQFRSDLHLHIGVLDPGSDMGTYLDERHEENYYAVSTIWGKYNIQQAVISNSDGTARLALTRSMNFEDGGENDYEYMGDLVYTDGASVAAVDLLYSIDKEYGDGERVEATVKELTGRYGIDYDSLEWNDMESKPSEDEVIYEETQMLTWTDKNVSYGPVKTFKLALTTNNETSVVTHHDTGVTIGYELTDDDRSVEEMLREDIEGAKRVAETMDEGTGFTASTISTSEDGTAYCSYTYTDKDGNSIGGTYAYKDSGTEGVMVRIQIYMNPIFGYEEGEEDIYNKVIEDFGFTG